MAHPALPSAGTWKPRTAENVSCPASACPCLTSQWLPNFKLNKAAADKLVVALAVSDIKGSTKLLLICPSKYRYISEIASAVIERDEFAWVKRGACRHLVASDRREYSAKQIVKDLGPTECPEFSRVVCFDLPELLQPGNFTELLEDWKALGCRNIVNSLVAELQWDGLTDWEDVFRTYGDLARGAGVTLKTINGIGEGQFAARKQDREVASHYAQMPYTQLNQKIAKLQPYGNSVYTFQGKLFSIEQNMSLDGPLISPGDKIYGRFSWTRS